MSMAMLFVPEQGIEALLEMAVINLGKARQLVVTAPCPYRSPFSWLGSLNEALSLQSPSWLGQLGGRDYVFTLQSVSVAEGGAALLRLHGFAVPVAGLGLVVSF